MRQDANSGRVSPQQAPWGSRRRWLIGLVGVILVGAGLCAVLGGPLASRQTEPAAPEDRGATGPSPSTAPPPRDSIIPPLACKPSPRDGLGTATIDPSVACMAGSSGEWTITFTAEPPGIDPGGFIVLQISPFWGWTPPQVRAPGLPGYTRVTAGAEELAFAVDELPLSRLRVRFPHGLPAGQTIRFHYGDQARADRFAEAEEIFQILVDGDADGHYATIRSSPSIRITARPASRLVVSLPSQARPGETITVTVAPIDPVGNWSVFPPGDYSFTLTRDEVSIATTTVAASGDESILRHTCEAPAAGVVFCDVSGPLGLRARSNVLVSDPRPRRLNVYFGDIHGHSRLSDGTGTPADYYRYAREVSGLSIAALTDHDSHGTFPLAGGPWQRICEAANAAYEPGHFVTFLGYEWTNWTYGHRNVYFRDGNGKLFSCLDQETDTPEELWSALDPYVAMTVPHHPGGGPVPIDWSVSPSAIETLVEVCSIHGCSESLSTPLRIYHPVAEGFVDQALAKGYRLGFIGSGDTHDGHPGQRSFNAPATGLLAVFAEDLTRESIWAALRRRHCYATSGAKIILFARVADVPMGAEVEWDQDRGAIPIVVSVTGGSAIERVEIVRDGTTVHEIAGNGPHLEFAVGDPTPLIGTHYYYVRVIQADGGMAWSSPTWVSGK